MERDYRAAARVFKALCDPKRLAILEELRGGEKCACVLQEPMELTQSGLSYHMKVLCESGLVESRQEGKWTHYQLSRTGREYAVKLLLCCAEGTSYEHFVHNMVEVEVEYTQRYMEVLRRLGRDIPVLDKSLCHIIASGMFNGIFEIVVHDMPRDQAMRDVDQLRAFYTAGWSKLMGE